MNRSRVCRHGISIIWMAIGMVAICAFVSLGVDYGRVQLAKTELRAAADAAALAGAAGMNISVQQAQADASNVAAANTANGSPVTLRANQDIDFGAWDADSRTFTVLNGSARSTANAIRVTARRTKARGNSIPLLFAQVVGQLTCDVSASAVASAAGAGNFGVVGLNYIKMGGNSSDSYYSPDGYTSGGEKGSIASNGNIYLSGNSYVHGDARPGIGMTVDSPSRVSGSSDPLTKPLNYPRANAGAFATTNDNANIPAAYFSKAGNLTLKSGESLTLPGGVYYLNAVNLGAGSTMSFTGPAKVYCEGNWVMNGHAETSGNLPKNLKIIMVGPSSSSASAGKVTIGGGSAMYAHIYAPLSPINLSGTGDFYGAMVGESIDMTGTSAIHYDTALRYGLGNVCLVQ